MGQVGPEEEWEKAEPRVPKGERVFTDGSKNEDGGVGAAVYEERASRCTYVKVLGRLTVLRAELSAILVALQRADPAAKLELFTDSQVSLRLIRRWVYCPHEKKNK